MANNRDLNVRLNADASGFERGFKSAEQSAKVFERELKKLETAQRDMATQEAAAYREQAQRVQDANQATAEIGRVIAIGAGAVVAGLGAAVMTAADFDSAMSSVQAATGESSQSMGKLRDAAIKAGSDTVYSATEAAGAIEELAKAGVSTADILDGGLAGALNLAAAGGVEVADAAEAAASAMTQFGLSGAQVPHIADLLAAAAGKAQGGVKEMTDALGQSGLIADQMGLTLEQTTGTLAAFASAGLLGSDAGTSFKTMLLQLANPTEKAATLMRELGINAYDAQGQFVGTADLAEQLQTRLGSLTEEQRNAALATIFGSDAMRAAAVLYEQGGEGIEEWTSAVNDSGYAAEVAETKLDNLKGDLEALQGSLQTAMITLGAGKLGAAARETAQDLDYLIDRFNSMPEFVQSDIQVLGALAGGVGLLASAAMIAVPKWDEFKDVITRNARATNAASTAMRRYGTVTVATALTVGAAVLGAQIADHLNTATASADQTTNALMSIATGAEVASSSFDRFDFKTLGFLTKNVTDAGTAVEVFGVTAASATQGGLNGFIDAVASLGGNERAFNNMVDDLDQSLANMVQNGNAEEAKAALDALLASVAAEGGDVDETRGKFKLYAAAVDSVSAAAQGAEPQMRNWSSAMSEASGAAQELTEAQVELREELVEGISSFTDPLSAYTEALDAKTDKERESAEATAKTTEDGADSWQDYAVDVNLSVQEYIEALQKQIDAQNNWGTNLLTLASRGLPQQILDQLTTMGVEGAPIVQKFVDATNDEFNKLVTTWPAATDAAAGQVADVLQNAGPILQMIAEASGTAVARGYAQKLAEGSMGVQDVILDYRNLLQDNIPDEATTTIEVDGMQVSRSRIIEIKRTMDQYLTDKTITIRAAIRAATESLAGTGQRVAQGQGGSGGLVFAAGGPVVGPGTGTSDSIPAWLSNGEFVVNARQTSRHRDLLEALNSGRQGFATGGLAGDAVVNLSLPNPHAIRDGLNAQLAPLVAGVQKAADAAATAAAMAADSVGTAGTAAAGGQGSGWQWQIATLRKAFPGLGLNSAYRPGSKTVSGNTSYHARGRAVDVPPRMDVFRWLLANYGNSPEIIYSPAGASQIKNGKPHYYTGAVRSMHFNHVHWAYDQGGIANGMGYFPKMTAAPERILSPEQTKSFDRLVTLLGGSAYADGGIVERGTRTAMPGGPSVAGQTGFSTGPAVTGTSRGTVQITQNPQTGMLEFSNGFDLGKFLTRNMTPVDVTIDDSGLRNANFALVQWTSKLNMAQEDLTAAQSAADAAAKELTDAQDAVTDALRDQQNAAEDVTQAQARLADVELRNARQLADAHTALDRAKASKDAERIADAQLDLTRTQEDAAKDLSEAQKELNDALADQNQANKDASESSSRLTNAQNGNAESSKRLYEATNAEASAAMMAADAKEKQAAAEEALNKAKAEALAYAQRITDAALAGGNIVSLFGNEDPVRAARFAKAAYDASVAQAQAATDADDWQAKLDQVAAAGLKVANTQRALGASYAQTKAILVATRTEVEKLALSYGFSAAESAALADSAVDLGASAASVATQLETQLKNVTEFAAVVKALRAKGLDEDLIAQLVDAGTTTGLGVGQSILEAGQAMIDRLNKAQSGLEAAANSLGQQESKAVYQPAPTMYYTQPIGTKVPLTPAGAAPVISRGTRTLKAAGGYISGPGGPTDDLVPAWLSNGEYVIKAAAVTRYGEKFFEGLNAMRYAAGGPVARATPVAGRGGQTVVVQVNTPTTTDRGPAIGSVFSGPVTIEQSTDLEAAINRATFLAGGALGTATGVPR